MVDKKIKNKSERSTVDKHHDGASTRYAMLEKRLNEFISKFDTMTVEMDEIKSQQAELIRVLKEKFKK